MVQVCLRQSFYAPHSYYDGLIASWSRVGKAFRRYANSSYTSRRLYTHVGTRTNVPFRGTPSPTCQQKYPSDLYVILQISLHRIKTTVEVSFVNGNNGVFSQTLIIITNKYQNSITLRTMNKRVDSVYVKQWYDRTDEIRSLNIQTLCETMEELSYQVSLELCYFHTHFILPHNSLYWFYFIPALYCATQRRGILCVVGYGGGRSYIIQMCVI